MDDCHTRIGNYYYHISEFAQRMEALGARYEPEEQLHDVKMIPGSCAMNAVAHRRRFVYAFEK